MNEFFISIFIFALAFLSSLFYLAKSKKNNLLSYLLNLNLEYILVGIIIYYFSQNFNTNNYDFTPYLAFLNVFTGILYGSQYKISLLKSINYRFYLFLTIIYLLSFLSLCIIFSLFTNKFILLAITFNTTSPYSFILLNKLFKNKKDVYTNIMLISLYPLYSLLGYTIYTFSKISYYNTIITVILISIIIVVIISTLHFNDKRVIYTLNFLIVMIITGISISTKFPPLLTGFITGLLIANIHYGDIFLNTINFIDKFIYIIIFIITGFFISSSINTFDIYYFILIILVCISFLFVRKTLSKIIFEKIVYKDSNTKINLSNIGILPAIIIIDLKIMEKISLTNYLILIIAIFMILEIYNFMEMKNEIS